MQRLLSSLWGPAGASWLIGATQAGSDVPVHGSTTDVGESVCHQWCSATCSRSWYAYALAATAVHNQHGQLLSQQNEIDCALTPAVQLAPREKRRGLQRVHTQSRRNQRIAQPTYHQSLSDCTVHVVHNLNRWCICTDTHVCCCLAGDAARMPPLLHTVRPQR